MASLKLHHNRRPTCRLAAVTCSLVALLFADLTFVGPRHSASSLESLTAQSGPEKSHLEFRTAATRTGFVNCGAAKAAASLVRRPAAGTLSSWFSNAPVTPADQLSPRQWLKMYRTLGLSEDATKEQVLKTTTRLRKKYAQNEAALERVENANLWIMTKMLTRKEEETRQRQQAARIRELGDSPRRLFNKYLAGYVPPNIRQMIEPPTAAHFKWTSGLLGLIALMGLCVPEKGSSFVGLAAASAMGLIYQRNRPEPVKDEMGNVGEVRKPNVKEMGATIAIVGSGVILSFLLSFGIAYLIKGSSALDFFNLVTCVVLWGAALLFKVYECLPP